MSQHLDRWIGWLKWPVALIGVLVLPLAALSVLDLLRQIILNPAPVLPFLGGFFGYLLLWWCWLRRPIFGSFFSTLEHELTHALFAVLTLHRVTGLRATWRQGGNIQFVGQGNWLITIAPYFFPTVCLVVMLAAFFLPESLRGYSDVFLGLALSYHVTSTLRETHPGQTDLARVGWLFSWMFLPAANLLTFGGIVSFAFGGPGGLVGFLGSLAAPFR